MREKSERYTRLINSSRWRKLRQTLIETHPLCVDCSVAFAREIHHVREPRSYMSDKDFEALFFDTTNLAPLCHACHVLRHTAFGKQTAEYYTDIADRRLSAAIEKFIGKK